jgi:hypothetical protein
MSRKSSRHCTHAIMSSAVPSINQSPTGFTAHRFHTGLANVISLRRPSFLSLSELDILLTGYCVQQKHSIFRDAQVSPVNRGLDRYTSYSAASAVCHKRVPKKKSVDEGAKELSRLPGPTPSYGILGHIFRRASLAMTWKASKLPRNLPSFPIGWRALVELKPLS